MFLAAPCSLLCQSIIATDAVSVVVAAAVRVNYNIVATRCAAAQQAELAMKDDDVVDSCCGCVACPPS